MSNLRRYACGIYLACLFLCATWVRVQAAPSELPNFVIVFTDDQGYNDVGCFGSPLIRTPHLDTMAREGRRFTSFYAQTVCGPSRAALMTGCYPLRVARLKQPDSVHPFLHEQEITIAEMLKAKGYATGCFGKWDLAGHTQIRYDSRLVPTRQGFGTYFGTPSSNDGFVNLLRNEQLIEEKADMNTLTRRYTDEAIAFIEKHQQHPFFVYLPHTMPHTRLGASDAFRGKSPRGLYGDVIEEIDWNIGRILQRLRELELERRTYVIFCSDNGPWYKKKEQGGSALPLRGAKHSTWEGGLRVPCIMWAPGRIPAGSQSDQVASTLDILPTLAALAGTSIPTDRVIDGHDIRPLMHGLANATSPTQAFYYYVHTHLQAIRAGRWKLHLPRAARPPWCPDWPKFTDPNDVFDIESPLLYDLATDVGEKRDLAAQHPEVVKRLLRLAEKGRNDIGDYDRYGTGARFYGDPPVRRTLYQPDS